MKTMAEQQLELLNEFIKCAQAARGGSIPEGELGCLVEWFDELIQAFSAANLIRSGSAVMYWDDDLQEPVFTLTEKGLGEASQDTKDKARDKNVFN
jgi:hypothetical protein